MADITDINVNGTSYNILDDEGMRYVSSPTNGDVLTTDADGQAVDSGVTLASLSGKQDALTTGDGISIANNTVELSGTTTNAFNVKSENITVDTTPSSKQTGKGFYFLDSAGTSMGFVRPTYYTSDNLRMQLSARRVANGTTVFNSVELGVDSDGKKTVALSEPSAWRSAIGYEGGNGVSIASDGTISNAFTLLNAQDLNNLSTYFVGYCNGCTNRPSGASTFGTLISIVGAGRRSQQYTSLSDGKIYTRTYYGSQWGAWTEVVTSYAAGYTLTISNSATYDIVCSGFVTGSGKSIYFHMPLDMPVTASNVAFSSLYILPRGDQGYMAGSSMVDVCADSSYTVTARPVQGGINVIVERTTAFTVTNNTPIAIQVRGRTITFS